MNTMTLKDFLTTVDGNDKFVSKAMEVLSLNEITECHELKGTDADLFKKNFGNMSGGLHGFLDRVIDAYEKRVKMADASTEDTRLGAVEAVLGNTKKEPTVSVNLLEEVAKISLDGLHQRCWPQTEVVDACASEAAKKKSKKESLKHKECSPFVYQELIKYMPQWCVDARDKDDLQAQEEEDENMERMGRGFQALAERLGAPKRTKKITDIMKWSIAFDRYAITAAAAKQLPYAAALAHKDICLSIALKAPKEGRGRQLGIYYDELVRYVLLFVEHISFISVLCVNAPGVLGRKDPCVAMRHSSLPQRPARRI